MPITHDLSTIEALLADAEVPVLTGLQRQGVEAIAWTADVSAEQYRSLARAT